MKYCGCLGSVLMGKALVHYNDVTHAEPLSKGYMVQFNNHYGYSVLFLF